MDTDRCVVILASCLMLLSIAQETSQDKKVTYLLGRPAENCISACASRGMSCIEIGAFPSNALSIFHSMNVTCTTPEETNVYRYSDHPNYCISGGWNGRCMEFKIQNETSHSTLCSVGRNPAIKRLCPCKENISTTDAPSTSTPLSTTTTTTILPSTSSSKLTSTTATLLGTQTRNQYTSDKIPELSTWLIVVIVIAVGLFISGFIFVIIFVKKKRERKDKSQPSRLIRSAPEQTSKNIMDGSDNIVYMESMVDMNSPTKLRLQTDNILYESGDRQDEPKCQLNNLYVSSCEDENSTMTTVNPIYGGNAGDEHSGFGDEYASIDDV